MVDGDGAPSAARSVVLPMRLQRWRDVDADVGEACTLSAKPTSRGSRARKGAKAKLASGAQICETGDGEAEISSTVSQPSRTPKTRKRVVGAKISTPRKRQRAVGAGKESDQSARPRRMKIPEPPEALVRSERLARDAVESGDFSWCTLQMALDAIEIPLCSHRKNVIPRGQSEVRGMLFGMYSYGGNFGVTKASLRHPWLTRLLVAIMRVADENFPFTSIQLNYNYASRPHVDKNNLGCSYIVGFGDYEGGKLWVHDECDEEEQGVPHTLEGDEDVSALYRVGQTFMGRLEDIKERWTTFDGSRLHYTSPFTGNRYSLIYFVSDQYKKSPAPVRADLAAAGFAFDWDAEDLEQQLRSKMEERLETRKRSGQVRLKTSRAELKRRGRCAARVWAQSWGLQCTAVCSEENDMCTAHLKNDKWKVHGRFGGDMPEAKRKEMAMWQARLVKKGERPPAGEPWTQLVLLSEESKQAHPLGALSLLAVAPAEADGADID